MQCEIKETIKCTKVNNLIVKSPINKVNNQEK